MRITKEADYALRICLCLARHGTSMATNSIAAETGLSRSYTTQILRTLTLAGITSGKQGNGGGYSLTHTPDTISIGTLIEAIDGEIAIVGCLRCTEPCSQYGERTYACPMQTYFSELNNDLRTELHRTMLSAFLSDSAHAALY